MILDVTTPEVFAPLWENRSRYKGAWGGRGSAKSWDRAQAVVTAMIERPGCRIACVREVQKSIKESVYRLISDTIQRMGVGDKFDCIEAEIRGPGGSLAVFLGMNDQNAESIKSLEGFDIVWWEEAQTAQQRSLDLLRPTIRKPGSELWFTWNPRNRTDPVDVLLRQTDMGDRAIVVEAQFSDNPWFSDELEAERLQDLDGDPDRYAHIWLGAYEAESDAQFIGGALVRKAIAATPFADIEDPIIMGVDVARHGDDRSVIYFRRGLDAQTIPPVMFNDKPDLMQLAARIADMRRQHAVDAIFVDEGGMGYGVLDRLRQMGETVIGINFGSKADRYVAGVPKTFNKRSEMWAIMRQWLQEGGAIPDDDALEGDLTGPLYSFDAKGNILLEPKKDMRKRGIRSPDIADALALTFAYPVQGRSVREQLQDRAVEEYNPIWD